MRGVLLAVLLMALPGSLGAQAGPSPDEDENRVGSAAAILVKGTRIAEKSRAQVGGWVGLVFGDRLMIGGGGVVLLDEVALPGSEAGAGFSLDMDYGGLFFRYWRPFSERTTGELGMVLGAGNAGVKDRLSGTELGSDNFLITEPEVSASFRLLPWLHVGGSAGYRLVWGLEDLPTVTEGDLRGTTGTVFLRAGGR